MGNPNQKILDLVYPYVYENIDKLLHVQINHEKLRSHPRVVIIDESNTEIEAQITYVNETTIEINTNMGVYYKAIIY